MYGLDAPEGLARIAVLILATDGRANIGSLTDWGGRPLLQAVTADVVAWGAGQIYVVLAADEEAVLDAVDFSGAAIVVDPEWSEGEASSIRVGLDALSRRAVHDAVLILRGNEPGIPADVPLALVEKYRMSRAPIVVPRFRYAVGSPMLVDASLWDRLMGMTGDARLHDLVTAHPEWVEEAWVDHAPLRRLETDHDVADLRPRH